MLSRLETGAGQTMLSDYPLRKLLLTGPHELPDNAVL